MSINHIKCMKCGHEWFPRIVNGMVNVPVRCPSCKNDWRKPKKKGRKKVVNDEIKNL